MLSGRTRQPKKPPFLKTKNKMLMIKKTDKKRQSPLPRRQLELRNEGDVS
jgi:hypothetical protein